MTVLSNIPALRHLELVRANGDLTAHNAIKAYRERTGMSAEIPRELVGSDWDQVFGAAGDDLVTSVANGEVYAHVRRNDDDHYDGTCYNDPDIRPARETNVSLARFDRRDIRRLLAVADGESDGPDWLALLQLWDGRYAYISGGCDYSGWG